MFQFKTGDPWSFLRFRLDGKSLERLSRIDAPGLIEWIAGVIDWVEPARVFVHTGARNDYEYVRRRALERREEYPSRYRLHTVHFDGPHDIARDRANTRILVPSGVTIPMVNTIERDRGLAEVRKISKGIMRGKEMFVSFYCYGPKDSPYTIPAVQVSDSAYLIHSEDILYRHCYDKFTKGVDEYMRFLHAAGERDENGWVLHPEKRRIYIDPEAMEAYTLNSQYAGNSIGLKKLALRICIHKSVKEGWLCEHMFIAGVKGPGDRVTYIAGAFPAGCGKTSTAISASDVVVGDDLAMIRSVGGEPHALNPEAGMFGIVDGVNPEDDPEIYEILTDPGSEVVFANVLLTRDGRVWWRGKPEEPDDGINYAGEWRKGSDTPPSHPNARFTTRLEYLDKLDPAYTDPAGVPLSALLFGGRDSDTWVPVEEAFNWVHGIVTKAASLESEKTAATLGGAGRREFNPFAILDFLSVSPGRFIRAHLDFEEKLSKPLRIYGVNYFLKGPKGFLNEKTDKRVWLKWIDLRVNNEADAVETPTGLIPVYEDLRMLFARVLDKEYSESDYEEQFKIRVVRHMEKTQRIYKIYRSIPDTPPEVFRELEEQWRRLKEARERLGDNVSPFKLDKR